MFQGGDDDAHMYQAGFQSAEMTFLVGPECLPWPSGLILCMGQLDG